MFSPLNNKGFRDTAFGATCKQEIISGIQNFINNAVILPRGEWDPSIRLEPPAKVPPQKKSVTEKEPEPDEALQRTGR